MSRIDDWCDEATFVDWEQPGEDAPDWQDGYRRLVADGRGRARPMRPRPITPATFPPLSRPS